MEAGDLIRNLEFQWHATIAANPDWEYPDLVGYLEQHGVSRDDIWGHRMGLAIEVGRDEPEWL